ncbi:MAG: helix-turn-helix transcriptional regulator [Burkholderiales bacterium]|nr:helix-turn-helix transcriptional regulator [Burkholderiales bacterium]
MPKRKTAVIDSFGERLVQLRKAAGYTQVEFAAEIGITQRMVAYYEAPDAHPPAHLLPQMAQALSVGTDVLLGMSAPRPVKKIDASRLDPSPRIPTTISSSPPRWPLPPISSSRATSTCETSSTFTAFPSCTPPRRCGALRRNHRHHDAPPTSTTTCPPRSISPRARAGCSTAPAPRCVCRSTSIPRCKPGCSIGRGRRA